MCSFPFGPQFEGEAAGSLSPRGPGKTWLSLPQAHVGGSLRGPLRPVHLPCRLGLNKNSPRAAVPSNYLLRPGWLTCLFCGCQTGGESFFHEESHPFQVEFSFCPSFVFANISGLIEHSSPFQPKHMLAFSAQYGNLGI